MAVSLTNWVKDHHLAVNKTRGGALTAILFHSSANASFEFLPSTYVHMIFDALLAISLVIGARMWQKLPLDHPAMMQIQPVNEISSMEKEKQ